MLIAGLDRFAWAQAQGALAVATLALHSMELLAVAGGALAWWWWTPRRAHYAWADALASLGWLLIIIVMFALGWQGTAGKIGQPAQLVYGAQGTWGVGPGVWLATVGIALAAAGCVVAWLVGRRSGVLPAVAIPPASDEHGEVHHLHTIG
jgi:hypothetical protein